MTSSDVTLGTASNPSEYRGRVTSLNGANIAAQVARSDGGTVRLIVQLDIDPNTGQASGTVQASP
jgi:C4-type Zn-finger protein